MEPDKVITLVNYDGYVVTLRTGQMWVFMKPGYKNTGHIYRIRTLRNGLCTLWNITTNKRSNTYYNTDHFLKRDVWVEYNTDNYELCNKYNLTVARRVPSEARC